ncbi:MAG: glutamate racemase [Pseudomonadota bacterium]
MARLLVLDSGVGGLSVVEAIRRRLPDASITYLADRDGFPYGDWPAEALAERVFSVVGQALDERAADAVIIACNTASTVALDHLREAFDLPFVGTVPGVKPAAAATKTGVIGLLATDGTIGRAYTDRLVREFASDVTVVPVGCRHLARLAEEAIRTGKADVQAIAGEIAPLFDRPGPSVDTVVLGCTHYPLVLDALKEASPRPVTWIDTGPAIAEQTARILKGGLDADSGSDTTMITGDKARLEDAAIFRRFGFLRCIPLSIPTAR